MYVSQGKIRMSTERIMGISRTAPGTRSYLTVWSTSRIFSLPAVKLLCKAINTKGRQKLHLGESNQHNSPVRFEKPAWHMFRFKKLVSDETGWPMLNIHISYKPHNSWRILFRPEGYPMQFSRLKEFRTLVILGGGWNKAIILQVLLKYMGVLPNGKSFLIIKGDVMGASVHTPRQRNSK